MEDSLECKDSDVALVKPGVIKNINSGYFSWELIFHQIQHYGITVCFFSHSGLFGRMSCLSLFMGVLLHTRIYFREYISIP